MKDWSGREVESRSFGSRNYMVNCWFFFKDDNSQ